MKIIRRILILLIFLFAVTFVFGYAYIKVQGRALAEKVLYHFTQQEVVFGKIKYQFPLGALIHKVKIGDIGDIENISFQINPLSVISKHLRTREIIFDRPLLRLTEERVKRVLTVSSGNPENTSRPQGSRNAMVDIDNFIIEGGRVDYYRGEVKILSLEHVDLSLQRVFFPHMKEMPFSLSLDIAKGGGFAEGGTADVKGVLDWRKHFIKAAADYSHDQSRVSATADIMSKEDDVIAVNGMAKVAPALSGDLGRTEVFQAMFGGGSVPDNKLSVQTDFSFTTKWGDFTVEKIDFKGNIISSPI